MTNDARQQLPADLMALMLRYVQLGRLLPKQIDDDAIDDTELVLAEMDKVKREIDALIQCRQVDCNSN